MLVVVVVRTMQILYIGGSLNNFDKESNEPGTRVFVCVFSLLLISEGKKTTTKTKTAPKAKAKECNKLCNQCTKQSA